MEQKIKEANGDTPFAKKGHVFYQKGTYALLK